MKLVTPIAVNDAVLTSSNVTENDYAAWAAGTTYALGAYVIKTSTHRIYKSLQAGNIGHDPAAEADPANPVWWQDYSATNRWKMFDGVVGAQTTKADSVSVTLVPSALVDTVALLNVSAASAQVVVTDATDGVVYDQTQLLTSDSGITDWYGYFFSPIVRSYDVQFVDLPRYLGASIAITLTDTGQTVAVGECIAGLARLLGGTMYGAKIGIRDYSVKEQDAFGNFTILQRAYSRRGTFQLYVDAGFTSELETILAGYRATAVLWSGTDIHAATLIYGFYKDFDIDIAYPALSLCSLEIEGLT